MSLSAVSSTSVARILILESRAAETQRVESELKHAEAGCECRHAWTLAGLRDVLDGFEPDLVIAGELPPPFTALDALRELQERCPAAAFILVAGAADEGYALACMRAGAQEYVLDDNVPELLQVVRRTLASRVTDPEIRVVGLVQAAKLESIKRLAAGVAHEVKNPLTVVVLGVEYLRKHLPAGVHEAQEVLDDMDAAAQRANQVIQGLLDFSSPCAAHREECGLDEIIDRALGVLERNLSTCEIRVEKRLPANMPRMALDAGRIEQAFVHVFRNAIQAMDRGGVLTITAGVQPMGPPAAGDRSAGSPVCEESAVLVQIEDTGSGIPEAILARIFEPFFSTQHTGHGTGLGLTLTKKIVDLHGGLIRVRNREGRGVRVSLLLPVGKIAP